MNELDEEEEGCQIWVSADEATREVKLVAKDSFVLYLSIDIARSLAEKLCLVADSLDVTLN